MYGSVIRKTCHSQNLYKYEKYCLLLTTKYLLFCLLQNTQKEPINSSLRMNAQEGFLTTAQTV